MSILISPCTAYFIIKMYNVTDSLTSALRHSLTTITISFLDGIIRSYQKGVFFWSVNIKDIYADYLLTYVRTDEIRRCSYISRASLTVFYSRFLCISLQILRAAAHMPYSVFYRDRKISTLYLLKSDVLVVDEYKTYMSIIFYSHFLCINLQILRPGGHMPYSGDYGRL